MKNIARLLLFVVYSLTTLSYAAHGTTCFGFYDRKSESQKRQIVRTAQDVLLLAGRNPTIQITYSAETFLRKLENAFDLSEFEPEILAGKVNAIANSVSQLVSAGAEKQSVAGKTDGVMKRLEILKKNKAPALKRLMGNGEDYLNSVALQLKNELSEIQASSLRKQNALVEIAEIKKQIKDLSEYIELTRANYEKYQLAIQETVGLFETEIANSGAIENAQSYSLVLNRLMVESEGSYSTISMLKAANSGLKKQYSITDVLTNEYSQMNRVEMATFLMEVGSSLSFVESEITRRATEAEDKKKKAEELAATNKAGIANQITTASKILVGGAVVSIAAVAGGHYILAPHTNGSENIFRSEQRYSHNYDGQYEVSSYQTNRTILNQDAADVIEESRKYDGGRVSRRIILTELPRFENAFTPEQFSHYVRQMPGQSLDSLPLRTEAVVRFYEKRIDSLNAEQVEMLSVYFQSPAKLRDHFKAYKKGKGPRGVSFERTRIDRKI
jgi:hypothetical protein